MKCPCEECISFAICKVEYKRDIEVPNNYPNIKNFKPVAFYSSILYGGGKCGALYEFIFLKKGSTYRIDGRRLIKANKLYGVNE